MFDASINPKWKTNTAGWHDTEKDFKTPSLTQSTWQTDYFTSKPNFYAWCHSFLFESIPTQPQYVTPLFFPPRCSTKNNSAPYCGCSQPAIPG